MTVTITTSQHEDEPIKPELWGNMSVTELYKQLDILNTRYYTAISLKNLDMQKQIQRGIDQLRELIDSKHDSVIY